MKLQKVLTTNFVYKLTLLIIKASGFAFSTLKSERNGKTYFRITWGDYVFFLISISFSILTFYLGSKQNVDAKLDSMILKIGTIFLWQASLAGIILTKCINLVAGKDVMDITLWFNYLDSKVRRANISFSVMTFAF